MGRNRPELHTVGENGSAGMVPMGHRSLANGKDKKSGVPGRIRTRDPLLRRQPLYPLSYWDSNEGTGCCDRRGPLN